MLNHQALESMTGTKLDEHQAWQDLSQQMMELQEQVRSAVSTELHEHVLESLSSLKLILRQAIEREPRTKLALETALVTLDDLLTHVRHLSRDLRPSMLNDFGLYPTLAWLIDLTQSQTALTIHRNFDELQEYRYAPVIETAIFRIAQEALANIVRHAQATEIEIELEERDGRLAFKIDDNGIGFDLEHLVKQNAQLTGISAMQARARIAGGSLSIDSVPMHGTHIFVKFPLTKEVI